MRNSNSKRKVGKEELKTSCGCCSDGQRNDKWLCNIIDNCEQVTMSKKLQWQWAGGRGKEKGKREERGAIKGKYDYITWQILSNYIIYQDLALKTLKWTWLSLQYMSRVITQWMLFIILLKQRQLDRLIKWSSHIWNIII